jgi:PAS domain-containing protein
LRWSVICPVLAVRMTEQQFRAVFDGSDVGIAIVDRGDRIDANAALRSMFEDDLDLIAVKAAQMFAEVLGDRRDSYRTEHCFKKSDGGGVMGRSEPFGRRRRLERYRFGRCPGARHHRTQSAQCAARS